MSVDFHSKPFSDGTKLKLAVFRGYIRHWVSVFMTESQKLSHVESVAIYDLFSGPGTDASGNPGSPMIIIDEIKQYCVSNEKVKGNKHIRMYFNDSDGANIETLKIELSKAACAKGCCESVATAKRFADVFEDYYPLMRDGKSANLVIMDQFGISDVTKDVVRRLSECNLTDILFFIPSTHIARFQNHSAFVNKIDLGGHNRDYYTIHRDVCGYFRRMIGDRQYYIAPFSIKDGGQIHGILFGSGSLYGLEKFLTVCWDIDSKTGEANYAVDRDPSWSGQQCLFEEMNVFKKIDLFERDLKEFIERENPDNLRMYEFVLTNGFSLKKAREILKRMESGNAFRVEPLSNTGKHRLGNFYLGYKETARKIRFVKATVSL